MNDIVEELVALEEGFNSIGPEVALTVKDPWMGVEGYVVCWNTRISVGGPLERCAKGGTRITPGLSLDEVTMLARSMALKNAAAGLPLGGAKSGLKADPDSPGFEAKYRRFVSLVKPILREHGGVFGGFGFDIGARPEHPIWACDELGSLKSFTGKPISMGGSDYDNEGIAGLGVVVAASKLVELSGESLSGLDISVQGLGAMGAAVVRYATEIGAQLRWISDPVIGGSYYLPDKLPDELIPAIISRDVNTVANLVAPFKRVDLDDILYQKVDVLFPCATQNVISVDNQAKVTARYISEGANNATSADAYKALHDRGVKVVPGIIANPGGIIAAYTELTTSITAEENERTHKIVDDAKAYTREKIAENVSSLYEIMNTHGTGPAISARYLALRNIFKDGKVPEWGLDR